MSAARGARPPPSGGGPLLPALDALRGVAILAVFAQHLGDRFLPFVRAELEARLPRAMVPWILTVLHHAHWGVDLFFVVSGFSLALGYLRAFSPGSTRPPPRALDFLKRRALRILPAYYVALAVTIAVHREVVTMPGFGASIASHLAVLQGYVAPGGIVLIGASWSLSTEAHYYLLLPFVARGLLTRAKLARAASIAACLVLGAWLVRALLHALVLEPGVHTALLEATQRRWIVSRLDQFVLGAMAALARDALLASQLHMRAVTLAPAALVAAAVALVVGFRLEGALYLEPGGSWPYAVVSVATATLVLAATLCEGRALRVVAPAPLCGIGVVSYGVFLYHQLVLGAVGARVPFARGEANASTLAWTAALALAGSVAMGWLSYRAIELPAMRLAARRPNPEGAVAAGAG